MARTRSGRGGSGGRGGRNDVPNPQVQVNDPEVQKKVQNNQEEIQFFHHYGTYYS